MQLIKGIIFKCNKLSGEDRLKITLKKIFDVELLEKMLNDFYEIIKVPISIVNIDGEVIVNVESTSLCADFFCKDEPSQQQCMNECMKNVTNVEPGNKLLTCSNGLKIYRTPIYNKETIVANIIMNQFLLNEPILENIVQEADKRDVQLDKFRNAYQNVPIIREEQMQQIIFMIDNLALMLSDSIEKQTENTRLEKKLINNQKRYAKLFANVNQGVVVFQSINDPEKNNENYYIVDINSVFEEIIDYRREELIGKSLSYIMDRSGIQLVDNLNNQLEGENPKARDYYSQKLSKYFNLFPYRYSKNEFVILVTDTTKKYEELILQRKQLITIVKTLGNLIEKKDFYTAGHQKKVAFLAYKIALEIRMEKSQIEGLYLAGMLHDIGKIGVPAEILTKPNELTEAEFEIIKSHVLMGYDILREIDFLWPVANIVLQHHEKLNGKGYPNGLTGDEISLEAKILCVADVVEAITAHRPYRPSLGLDFALEEIKRFSGIYYEPNIVDACIRVCSMNNWNEMIAEALEDSLLNELNWGYKCN